MVRKARRSLGALLADAQERGLVAQNVVYSMRKHRRSSRVDGNGKLEIGVNIPTPDEMRAIVAKLPHIEDAARWRPLLLTAIFTGLRASELRGLRWSDIDLQGSELHVRQRADRYGTIGRPKSEAGKRTVPLPPMLVSALREHWLASPKNELDLVFANSRGGIEHRNTIVEHGFRPAQVAAGVVNGDGKAKYPGLHSAAAFLCLVVHQPAGRWRAGVAAQSGAGAARSRLDPDDGGYLRPLVPARRRRQRACSRGEAFYQRLSNELRT